MSNFNSDIFEGAVEITAAVMEEAEIEISVEGGEKAADFCAALYKRLLALTADCAESEAGKPGVFETYRDAQGEHRFRLKAGNGETIAVSEGYRQKESCLKGIESVKRSAPAAEIKEL